MPKEKRVRPNGPIRYKIAALVIPASLTLAMSRYRGTEESPEYRKGVRAIAVLQGIGALVVAHFLPGEYAASANFFAAVNSLFMFTV